MGESAVDERSRRFIRSTKIRKRRFFSTAPKSKFICARARSHRGGRRRLLDELSLKIEKELGNPRFPFAARRWKKVIGRRLTMTGVSLWRWLKSCTRRFEFAQRLTSVAGSSKYFIEGCVTYSNEFEDAPARCRQESIKEFGRRQPTSGRDMARGVRHIAKTDFGLAVTGIAGPGGGLKRTGWLIYIASLTTRIRSTSVS
jgi:PncC family amidohydrolase